MKVFYFSSVFLILASNIFGQNVTVNVASSAAAMVSSLVDPAVTVSNITQSCKSSQRGTFTNTGSSIGMPSGIVLTTGNAVDVAGPNKEACNAETANTAVNGNYPFSPEADADLKALDAAQPDLYDICKLEFDFKVNSDTLQLTYLFGSEEYTAYSKNGSEVNDLFGFFLSGNEYGTPVNFATVPGTSNYVGIKTVNQRACCNAYYFPNCPKASADPNGLQYNGYTTLLTSKIKITPNLKYHIKIAIADASDDIIDSGVFLKSSSFTITVPITLLYFKAGDLVGDKTKNKISWATSTEKNNERFEILRSSDGHQFSVIATIPGANNSSVERKYSFTDEKPLDGTSYYRLKQVDYDGKESYSQIESITKHLSIKTNSIFPSPIGDNTNLSVTMPTAGPTNIFIMDITGKTLLNKQVDLVEGENTIQINTADLQKGCYLLQISTKDYTSPISKLVK